MWIINLFSVTLYHAPMFLLNENQRIIVLYKELFHEPTVYS